MKRKIAEGDDVGGLLARRPPKIARHVASDDEALIDLPRDHDEHSLHEDAAIETFEEDVDDEVPAGIVTVDEAAPPFDAHVNMRMTSSSEEADDEFARSCKNVYDSVGCAGEMEYNVLNLATVNNLSQGVADKIIQLIKDGCRSRDSIAEVHAMPKKISTMYNRVGDRLSSNRATGSGMVVDVATVDLPDAECFRNNNLRKIDIPYMNPRHWIETMPQHYTMKDLALVDPGYEKEYPKTGIADFNTCRRMISMTNDVRMRLSNPHIQVAGVIPYADATPVGSESITPWSFLFSCIKRSVREKDFGRYFCGYSPDVSLDKEFVGSHESYKTFNRLISHATDNFFFGLFEKLKDELFTLRFKKTSFDDTSNNEYVEVHFVVRLLLIQGDYPALMRMLNMKESTQSLMPCRICEVPGNMLWDTRLDQYPNRDYSMQNKMRRQYLTGRDGGDGRGRMDADVKAAKEYLRTRALNPRFGGLHAWYNSDHESSKRMFGTEPEKCMPHEAMHALELGIFKEICGLTNEKGVANKVLVKRAIIKGKKRWI
jgi:hypothetical protein